MLNFVLYFRGLLNIISWLSMWVFFSFIRRSVHVFVTQLRLFRSFCSFLYFTHLSTSLLTLKRINILWIPNRAFYMHFNSLPPKWGTRYLKLCSRKKVSLLVLENGICVFWFAYTLSSACVSELDSDAMGIWNNRI